MTRPPTVDRRALGAALATAAPWTRDAAFGPATVDAGDCDRCGRQPRLVATCGPQPWRLLCRDCLLDAGSAAFCDGHRDTATAAIAFATSLPADWATLTRLAWIATGELRADPDFLALAADELRTPAVMAVLGA